MGYPVNHHRVIFGVGNLIMGLVLSIQCSAGLLSAEVQALPSSLQTRYENVQSSIDGRQFDVAADEAEALFLDARATLSDRDAVVRKLRGFVAGLHHQAGNLTAALRHYTRLVSYYSEFSFDPALVEPLHGLAQTYNALGLDEDAEQALLRAQNIAHREDGVYTMEQVAILEDLTDLKQSISVVRRDQQRRYHLRIHEDAFGKDDPNVVPSVLRLARYLDQRAVNVRSHLLLKEYRRRVYRTECHGLYERAIGLMQKTYGSDDPRVIEPMREYAEVLLRHRSSRARAVEVVREVERILVAGSDATVADRAAARVEIADYFNMWNDGRADRLYREAWAMIDYDPDSELARKELFGIPVRLTDVALGESPFPIRVPPLVAEGDQSLFSEVSYTVTVDGRVRNVETVGGNIPIRQANPLRLRMARIKYRPRFVDGEPVPTLGVLHTQKYRVNRYAKKRPIDHVKCTSCTDFQHAW